MAQARSPCAAGLNMPFAKGLSSDKDIKVRGHLSNLDVQRPLLAERFFYRKKIFANYKSLPRGGFPSAAGPNLPFAKGILSNKDNQARGRQSKLKSTNFTPRREDFPKGKICGEIKFAALYTLYKGAAMHGSTLFQGSCLPPHFPDNGGMPRTLLRTSGAADARSRPSPSALPAQGAPLLRGERRYSFRHIGSVHSIVDILAHPGAFRQVFCGSFPCLPL